MEELNLKFDKLILRPLKHKIGLKVTMTMFTRTRCAVEKVIDEMKNLKTYSKGELESFGAKLKSALDLHKYYNGFLSNELQKRLEDSLGTLLRGGKNSAMDIAKYILVIIEDSGIQTVAPNWEIIGEADENVN